MEALTKPTLLMLVLLNPFMLWIYLQDMLQPLDGATVRRVILRGSSVAAAVFVFFAWTGDALFSTVLQVRFASFLIFGGVIFLVIATKFVLQGAKAKHELVGGSAEHIAGSIAMPFMIGPGTVSASVVAGQDVGGAVATLALLSAVVLTAMGVLALRWLHGRVAERYAGFVDRYSSVVGRVSALVLGTIAMDMILTGIDRWRGP